MSIDGAIGAMSGIDETFGYHAGGKAPAGRVSLPHGGDGTAVCPGFHALAVSKLVAAPGKDAGLVRVPLKERMIDIAPLCARNAALDATPYPLPTLLAWARRRAAESAACPT